MSLRKKKIVMYVCMLLMTMCLFFSNPVTSKAKESKNEVNTITSVTLCDDDIPKEITEPIERGKKLLAYLVVSLGAIAALVGLVFLVIAFIGHNPEQRITGFILLGGGIVLALGTVIVNWLMGETLF